MTTTRSNQEAFTVFAREAEPRLRHALTAAVGQQAGRDATAEALSYGWEHWDRISAMENPAGYLYRVGRTAARRRRRRAAFLPVPASRLPHVEPRLPEVMRRLTERQRVAVFLAYGMGWTRREVAELLGISANAVGAHLSRGLAKLRSGLGVTLDD